MEAWGLTIGNFNRMAVLLLQFSASISLAPAQDLLINDTDTIGAAGAIENDTTAEEAPAAPGVSVQGIWKATLGEMEIVMAMNQSGESIFGLAKFEGEDPWNAALAGSHSQDAVSLSLAALQGKETAATYISAALEGDTMEGFFIRSDSSGKASRGNFAAFMISPDTSGYTPAIVADAPLPAAQTSPESAAVEEAKSEELPEPDQVQETESRFQDVTQLAKGINPNIMPRMAPL
jgi:hypothetical protein